MRDHYAAKGRPSVDPVVFFKLQLVMFFEGIRSERQLMAVAEDRLSVRWYLGYNLDEALPDHSSMTRIRQRFGLAVFRQFFEHILDLCTEAGLVWGREVLVDASKVPGNADLDSLVPRLKDVVDDHLVELFGTQAESPTSDHWNIVEECRLPADRPLSPGYERLSHRKVSRTDPDATPMTLSTGRTVLGYQDHYLVDGGRARIILNCLVLSGDVMENQPFLDQFRHTLFRRKLRPKRVIADTAYGTIENLTAMDQAGIQMLTPLPNWEKSTPVFQDCRLHLRRRAGRLFLSQGRDIDAHQCGHGQPAQAVSGTDQELQGLSAPQEVHGQSAWPADLSLDARGSPRTGPRLCGDPILREGHAETAGVG